MSLTVFVPGKPVPQGSKRHVGNGRMIEMGKDLKPWRESIRWTVLAAWKTTCFDGAVRNASPIQCGVSVRLTFVMPRPASAPKRKTPPAIKRPDIDKLVRAVLDAIGSTGTVWRDDSQVVELFAAKRIAELDEAPGVLIQLQPAITEESAA